jgi:hypothetical protein
MLELTFIKKRYYQFKLDWISTAIDCSTRSIIPLVVSIVYWWESMGRKAQENGNDQNMELLLRLYCWCSELRCLLSLDAIS